MLFCRGTLKFLFQEVLTTYWLNQDLHTAILINLMGQNLFCLFSSSACDD
ncbi:MAG: hypothetical protein AB4368_06615 [Xenococcaceae cyanobacterium]